MNDRASAPGALALVQALVNTLDLESGADALDTSEGRAPFGVAPGAELTAARELRESLRAACLAHAGHAPHAPVPPLSQLLMGAPLLVKISEEDGSAELTPAEPSKLASRVAAAIAEAVTAGTWSRLKACEAADCHWAYYDRSPASRSRWCDMGVCGARAKMRAYRARKTPPPGQR
ncbi:CGNR zinc finger domain-containing protein [Streptomyces durmitorensis]|uniref:CGNR zinc finger domain-containing protein n=1 Tax=Streptomyces durmitorensis TaxID=319947 RepID=A0ABY4PY44_9ACTN|nr:CGNR zinc finger domain-containing protein [Streptomyces durmitorensis]UQT58154.1 CGNR zinc finger domain-containing protein [Streptomyces durmitorensis]